MSRFVFSALMSSEASLLWDWLLCPHVFHLRLIAPPASHCLPGLVAYLIFVQIEALVCV